MLARNIAVVDDGPAEGRQRKARHHDIDADHDAEEGDQDHRRMAPGEGPPLALVGHGSVPGRSNWMVSRSPRGSSSSARTAMVKSCRAGPAPGATTNRSEEHTSELQSLMRISYACFCMQTKT